MFLPRVALVLLCVMPFVVVMAFVRMALIAVTIVIMVLMRALRLFILVMVMPGVARRLNAVYPPDRVHRHQNRLVPGAAVGGQNPHHGVSHPVVRMRALGADLPVHGTEFVPSAKPLCSPTTAS